MSDNPFAAPASTADLSASSGSFRQFRPVNVLTHMIEIGMLVHLMTSMAGLVTFTIAEQTMPFLEDENAIPSSWEQIFVLIAAIVFLIIILFTFAMLIVVLCIFFHRANSNARDRGATGLAYSPGACVGVWFTPIVNMYFPLAAVREIYQASCVPVGEKWKQAKPLSCLSLWWFLWLSANLVSLASAALQAHPIFEGWTRILMDFVGMLFYVGAGVLLVIIVRSIAERQRDWPKTIAGPPLAQTEK